MLPFDLTWLEPFHRRSFRERFDSVKRIVNNALSALTKSQIISITWIEPSKARFFLADGTFIAFDFQNTPSASNPLNFVLSASHDRLLCEQLESALHEANDALISNDFVLLVSSSKNQSLISGPLQVNQHDQSDHNLYFVYFGRRHVGDGCEQLSALDPHIQILPLGSGTRPSDAPSHRSKPAKRNTRTQGLSIKPSNTDRLKLVMNSSQEIFCVWWTNLSPVDSKITHSAAEEEVEDIFTQGKPGGALLFQMNASACVLSPLVALSPASNKQFLLLSFSHTAACELFAIEWTRKKQHEMFYFVLSTTTYLIDQDKLVKLDSSPLCIPDKDCLLSPSLGELSPRDDRLLVAMRNGNLFLINLRACVIASSTTKFNTGIAAISWHPTGNLFAVVDDTGKLFLLDLGLSTLQLFQLNQSSTTSPVAHVLPYAILGDINASSKTSAISPVLSWNPDNESAISQIEKLATNSLQSSNLTQKDNGTLIVAWTGVLRGLGVFRLMLPHAPTSSYLIRHWLSLANTEEKIQTSSRRSKQKADSALAAAVAIVCALDFDIDGEQAVRCVTTTATALLRQRPMNAAIDALLDKCLACYCNPIAPISEVTKLEFGPVISQILRRRAINLLRHGKLEAAFDVAANRLPKPASDLLTDTFYAALERGELALAKAAYSRARKQVASAVAAVELPTVQLSDQQETEVDEEQVYSF